MNTNVHTIVRPSVPCYFCNEFLEEKYLTEHVTHCAAVLKECPNKCGVYVPRRNLEAHQKSCNKKISKRNNQIKDIQDSVWKEKVFSVLTLLRLAVDQGEKERIRLQDDLSRNLSLLYSQQESLATLHLNVVEVVEESRNNNATLNQRLSDLEMVTNNLQQYNSLNFQQFSEQLRLLEETSTNEQSKHKNVSNDWTKELKNLKTFIAKESICTSDMWQEHLRHFNDLKLELEMRCKNSGELTSKYEILSEKIDSLLEKIHKHSEIIVKQKSDIKGLKFQMKENLKYVEELITENCGSTSLSSLSSESIEYASTNGRIIWRIDRYKEKMNEAKETDCVFYSPIFYNKEYGYTLRIELFLNGKGQWKDRHIIGCLRVENGKWDPLLDWPCVLKAAVILRDQDNPANDLKKIVKAVGYDKNSSNDFDKESGLYMFIPHTTLSRYSGYTKNNVLFLDIQVKDVKISASTASLIAN